jgi:hypothetical protein
MVNAGQSRSKSTLVKVNGHADVALGLTCARADWTRDKRVGAWQKNLDGGLIFGRRVRPPIRLILARLGRASRDLSNSGGGVVIRVL